MERSGPAARMLARLFLTLAPLLLAACGSEDPAALDVSDSSSYPKASAKWPSRVIDVCWESTADAYSTEKSWLRSKVEAQYETKTNVQFEGWDRCTTTSKGVHITIADGVGSNPHTRGLGKSIDGMRNGMELNFTFTHWSESCQNRRRSCIESIGVHEFGHAVGLAHEHNRPDTPDTCTKNPQGTAGDQPVGSWDVNSVMNYCNPVYNNGGNLSPGDVAGIATLYGRKE